MGITFIFVATELEKAEKHQKICGFPVFALRQAHGTHRQGTLHAARTPMKQVRPPSPLAARAHRTVRMHVPDFADSDPDFADSSLSVTQRAVPGSSARVSHNR